MARSKLYDKPRGGDREEEVEETPKGDEPEPAQRVRGKSESGPAGHAEGVESEHEAMFKAHEAERRDQHGRHRTEHRDMEERHKEERAAITDHEFDGPHPPEARARTPCHAAQAPARAR